MVPYLPLKITFQDGTLLLDAPATTPLPLAQWGVFDERVGQWRAEARHYAAIILHLYRRGLAYDDQARAYEVLPLQWRRRHPPREYQQEAVNSWWSSGGRGLIVLPTGTGKSYVAHMAMAKVQRSTLVVAPTIDLMEQWARQLEAAFGIQIGLLGGGSRDVLPLTISTYDSAAMMMDFIGNRFGLLVVDECHHLPGPFYQQLARFAIAPYRLGLSATPERQDGGDAVLDELLGPICYRRDIDEMEGNVLAAYRTERICLDLEEDEMRDYEANRTVYIQFLHSNRINLSAPRGWNQFLMACSRQAGGREALQAYLTQRRLAMTCRAKLQQVWTLLRRHAGERILCFTADNRTAYELGQRFYLPVITHHTKIAERRVLLDAFRAGDLPVLVTSRVLNEGVDVPEASVGIVVSGSGSIREHVQRLGRILRPAAGKQAVLYELISYGTAEWNVSDRRRQHRAYERPDSMSE
ncbi:MAG: DEAD/DEAH box helicase [Lentisphaerae bacterium]|jgi:superfamily II DNA or RNA helicase|nr:DEAD/DEAH box helicase [Lentisphaerota bacterium]